MRILSFDTLRLYIMKEEQMPNARAERRQYLSDTTRSSSSAQGAGATARASYHLLLRLYNHMN